MRFRVVGILLVLTIVFGFVVPLGMIDGNDVTAASAEFRTEPMIAASGSHTLALKSDGTVWAWGGNSDGQLGNGTNTLSSVPVQVTSLSNVISIATGGHQSLALLSDGTIRYWGGGRDVITASQNTPQPVQIDGRIADGFVAIAAGNSHALALKSDGTVWSWGRNTHGQLGINSTENAFTMQQVHTISNITAISAGSSYSLALRDDGTIFSWGLNRFGQLGVPSRGFNDTRLTPVEVTFLETDAVAIAAGSNHSAAVRSDGRVATFGTNAVGQLGDSPRAENRRVPRVPDMSNAIAVSVASAHTTVLREDGTVWGWGELARLPNSGPTHVPQQAPNLNSIVAVTSGLSHAVALQSDGTVWTWGRNGSGQLGIGTTNISGVTRIPVMVVAQADGSEIFNLNADAATHEPVPITTTTRQADLLFRNIGIFLNTGYINLRDAEGNTVEPFIIGGTTYLPVRALANALGLGVSWVDHTSTIMLTSNYRPPAIGGPPWRDLSDVPPSTTRRATLLFRDITIMLDGQVITPRDADGNIVEPFIIDGTTYLPLRALADALGLGVGWVDATSTVLLGRDGQVPTPLTPPVQQPTRTLVGTWTLFGEPYYTFNYGGRGIMNPGSEFAMNIGWTAQNGVLTICISPDILCVNGCIAPVIWGYSISGNRLTLSSHDIPGFVLTLYWR